MEQKLVRMKVSALKMDTSYYPRSNQSNVHISNMVDTLKSGTVLPPIVACSKTYTVVDGYHRISAAQMHQRKGTDTEVDVELLTYTTDNDMLLDAAARNSSHGLPLSAFDKTRYVLLCQSRGIDDERIRAALRMTERRFTVIVKRRALETTEATGQQLKVIPKTIPLKASLSHLSGMQLSERQQQGNQTCSGLSLVRQVNQVHQIIVADLIDWRNPALIAALLRLREALSTLDLGPTADNMGRSDGTQRNKTMLHN